MTTKDKYGKQHRGTRAAYEAYFAGMDSSMQQKVALTTAHFPVRGRIADMGCGSGRGTCDLARLYDSLELIGVDINSISVERSRNEFQNPNLSYECGDISEMVFPPESLDGILDSSVLHHVTSFNDFSVERVYLTLDRQVAQLKPGGVIIIRDFVIPDGPDKVYLDLRTDDGAATGEVPELSSSALFEHFAQTWRSSVNREGSVPFQRHASQRKGFVRYEVALRAAAEFVLRKDYKADWPTESLEEYTYLSQSQFERAFRERGLRIVTSRPLWNPWIVRNRFEKKFYLSDIEGRALPFPPTNYLIVGEKIESGEGAEVVEVGSTEVAPKFLAVTAHRHKATGKVFELVERPNQTIDILPWFEEDGQVFIVAKKDFPRPIVNAAMDQQRPNSASVSGYITEPITAIIESDEPLENAVRRVLKERGSFSSDEILDIGEPFSYFTSPGGINERVFSCAVRVRPRIGASVAFPNYTKFKSAGSVRELDAAQVLRACHIGGMFDARIEIGIYHLARTLGISVGPWIGAPIKLTTQTANIVASLSSPLGPEPATAFESVRGPVELKFLSVREGTFAEHDQEGQTLAEVQFEYVVPGTVSVNTVTAIPVVRTENETLVGLELRDLPAVQSFTNNSRIVTVPAWRLPRSVAHVMELPAFLSKMMARDFKVTVNDVWELGGAYYASPGVTPESVYPYVVEIDSSKVNETELIFINAELLKLNVGQIRDGHLLTAAFRLIHALGV